MVEGKQRLQTEEEKLSLSQQQFYETQGLMEKSNSQWQGATELIASYQEQREKNQEEIQRAKGEVKQINTEAIGKEKEVEAIKVSLMFEQQAEEQLKDQMLTQAKALEEYSLTIEQLKEDSITNMQAKAKNHNLIQSPVQELGNQDRQKNRTDERAGRIKEEKETIVKKLDQQLVTKTTIEDKCGLSKE